MGILAKSKPRTRHVKLCVSSPANSTFDWSQPRKPSRIRVATSWEIQRKSSHLQVPPALDNPGLFLTRRLSCATIATTSTRPKSLALSGTGNSPRMLGDDQRTAASPPQAFMNVANSQTSRVIRVTLPSSTNTTPPPPEPLEPPPPLSTVHGSDVSENKPDGVQFQNMRIWRWLLVRQHKPASRRSSHSSAGRVHSPPSRVNHPLRRMPAVDDLKDARASNVGARTCREDRRQRSRPNWTPPTRAPSRE